MGVGIRNPYTLMAQERLGKLTLRYNCPAEYFEEACR